MKNCITARLEQQTRTIDRLVKECVTIRIVGMEPFPTLVVNRKKEMVEWKVCETFWENQLTSGKPCDEELHYC